MSRNPETNIANEILLELGGVNGGCLAWKQVTGNFRAMDNPERIVSVGTPGLSDIMTVVPVTVTSDMVGKTLGLAVAIEVKTLTGKQRKAQQLWQLAMERRSGIYLIARSAQQAREQVANLVAHICGKS